MTPSILDLFKCQQRRIEETLDLRFERVDERLDRLQRLLEDVAADVDELDRFNKPHGDGTKLPRNRRC